MLKLRERDLWGKGRFRLIEFNKIFLIIRIKCDFIKIGTIIFSIQILSLSYTPGAHTHTNSSI